MANQEIHEPTIYSQEIRKLQTTDPSHADVFNPLFERLINNDVFLKSLTERLIQEHTHSGADGEGSQIPLANIKMPLGEGGIVTDKELALHINERNPHGTRAVDAGAASKQEFDEHLAGHLQIILSSTVPSDPTTNTWWYEDLGDSYDLATGGGGIAIANASLDGSHDIWFDGNL